MLDLCGLITGWALALSLPWLNMVTNPKVVMDDEAPPVWEVICTVGGEWLQKAALALLVVIAMRRGRYGGLIRPAELLVVVVAGFLASWQLDEIRVVADSWHWVSHPISGHPNAQGNVPGAAFYWSHGSAIGASLMAIVGMLVFQRTMPNLAKAALSVIAVVGFQVAVPCMALDPPGYDLLVGWNATLIGPALVVLLNGLLAGIIGVAAIVDVRRRRQWTWVERASLTLAIGLLLLSGPEIYYQSFVRFTESYWPTNWEEGMGLALLILSPVLLVGLGGLVNWSLGRWLSRDATPPSLPHALDPAA